MGSAKEGGGGGNKVSGPMLLSDHKWICRRPLRSMHSPCRSNLLPGQCLNLFFLTKTAVAAKAPRKQVGNSSGASSSSSSKTPSKKGGYSSGGGGNPLRIRDVPSWQKGTSQLFFAYAPSKNLDDRLLNAPLRVILISALMSTESWFSAILLSRNFLIALQLMGLSIFCKKYGIAHILCN